MNTGWPVSSRIWLAAAFLQASLLLPGGHLLAADPLSNPLATLIFEASYPETTPAAEPSRISGDRSGQQATENDIAAGGNPAAAIQQARNAISDEIDAGNQYTQSLSEQYNTLGRLYYQAGEFEAAIGAFEDAMHIQKVNKGLYNLDQAPLVENIIRCYIALNDFYAVDNHRHYLYYLQEKSLAEDAPELIAAKLAWADWNLEAYTKGYRDSYTIPVSFSDSMNSAQQAAQRTSINIPYTFTPPDIPPVTGGSGDTGAGSTPSATGVITLRPPMLNQNAVVTNAAITDYALRSIPFELNSDMIVNQRLHAAENLYLEVFEQLSATDQAPIASLENIQHKLASIGYLVKKELDQYEQTDNIGSIAYNRANQSNRNGAELILGRRYVNTRNAFTDYIKALEARPDLEVGQRARAYIELGDLNLGFEKPQQAFRAYGNAYDILSQAGMTPEEIAGFINPRPDIAVPEFATHQYSRGFFGIADDIAIPFKGHIDVAYNIDRYGAVKNIELKDYSDNTPELVRKALVRHLRDMTMRPRIVENGSLPSEDIALRYHYYY